jgi:hypothetical protein
VLQAPATAGGSNTLPSGAGILAALSLAQIWTAIQQFNLGITLAKSDGTLPATIVNDTSGGVNITGNGGLTWEFANGGTLVGPKVTTPLQFQGSTSGLLQLTVPAVAGSSVLALPAATGTLTIGNPTFQKFTANGTFTIPTGVTGVKVTVVGGGAGGGGGNVADGGGVGSGWIALKYLSGLTPGNTITVTVGGTANGGAASTGGTAGNASSISSGTQTITTVTANGGGAGGAGGAAATLPGPGGTGGAISTNGDFNGAGSPGIFGSQNVWGGPGGSTFLGGGASTNGGTTGGNGIANTGGGGAGGHGANAGGNGAAGMVIFEWVQ